MTKKKKKLMVEKILRGFRDGSFMWGYYNNNCSLYI